MKLNIEHIDKLKLSAVDISPKAIKLSEYSLPERIKELASAIVIDYDYELVEYSKKVRNSIAHIDFNNAVFSLNELEDLKVLGEIQLKKADKFYNLFANGSNYLSLKKHLRKYNTVELLKFYLNEDDQEKKDFIWSYILHKEKKEKYSYLFKKIDKNRKKLIDILANKSKRNLRFYIRKIHAFLFKNLDDYHEYSII